ncbi:hypothetical protein [Aureivirga sp. CE67]|uniref:hypothetical protein n=1 Tax=Aureivirga sp. CE67 TaxID=1788983 RepID=UPI0018CA80AF|nr:hypothetical protein [Aureivirga sp. CE67]
MNSHYQLSDQEFENQFSNCTIDPKIFSHEAHIRLAWIYIKKYGLEEAKNKYTFQLKNLTVFLGATSKYNHTVTIIAMRIIHKLIENKENLDFKNFINQNPELNTDFKNLINNHYSFDVFKNDLAKTSFIEPDLIY